MIEFFGIRHHGPGSARSIRKALSDYNPDYILVEGPADASDYLHYLTYIGVEPPLALLGYEDGNPHLSSYFPFAVFSPEYQAIIWGFSHNVPIAFMDLPQKNCMAIFTQAQEQLAQDEQAHTLLSQPENAISNDPLGYLARAAGFDNGDAWWEYMVEQRINDRDIFQAITEAMTALRERNGDQISEFDAIREAYMREFIRGTKSQNYERIAVICGAWHVPALMQNIPASADKPLLTKLPKLKIKFTWIPWTHSRFSMQTGYGAGIESPGWYQHIFHTEPQERALQWMSKVALLLRQERFDASTAQVIDASRLAHSLAAIRDKPQPGLNEMNDAAQSVFTQGQSTPMQLIHDELIVGETIGSISPDMPLLPIQQDFEKTCRRVYLKPQVDVRELKLDLREERDRQRSYLLHRLLILGVKWGEQGQNERLKGTFTELWTLDWYPQFMVYIIEANRWGNTIEEACSAYLQDLSDKDNSILLQADIIGEVIQANLPSALDRVMRNFSKAASLTSDILTLMRAFPPLANILIYGNVRHTDQEMIAQIVDYMVRRIFVSMSPMCLNIDNDVAEGIYEVINHFHAALHPLHEPEYESLWYQALSQIMHNEQSHGLIAGRCCRILVEGEVINQNDAARMLTLRMNVVDDPHDVASWLEGFLSNSGLILIYDNVILQLVDDWLGNLTEDHFISMLPLLRRTMSTYSHAEQKRIWQRILSIDNEELLFSEPKHIDPQSARRTLPLIANFLNLNLPDEED